MYLETECVMAVQGHRRLLILVPIESAYIRKYNFLYKAAQKNWHNKIGTIFCTP